MEKRNFYTYLRLSGFDADPDVVRGLLGCPDARIERPGERYGGRGRLFTENVIKIYSRTPDGTDLDEQVQDIFHQICPTHIAEFMQKHSAAATIEVVIYITEGVSPSACVYLEPERISQMALISAALGVDIYALSGAKDSDE